MCTLVLCTYIRTYVYEICLFVIEHNIMHMMQYSMAVYLQYNVLEQCVYTL